MAFLKVKIVFSLFIEFRDLKKKGSSSWISKYLEVSHVTFSVFEIWVSEQLSKHTLKGGSEGRHSNFKLEFIIGVSRQSERIFSKIK